MSSFKLFNSNRSSFWCNISNPLLIKLSLSFTGHLVEMK